MKNFSIFVFVFVLFFGFLNLDSFQTFEKIFGIAVELFILSRQFIIDSEWPKHQSLFENLLGILLKIHSHSNSCIQLFYSKEICVMCALLFSVLVFLSISFAYIHLIQCLAKVNIHAYIIYCIPFQLIKTFQ